MVKIGRDIDTATVFHKADFLNEAEVTVMAKFYSEYCDKAKLKPSAE